VKTAGDIIEPLRRGIKLMEDEPQFLPWLREYLRACIENPKATIYASR
jgi:hypothetical protein